ncbi:OLR1 isoform 9 [Pan troglodytes]|uniref:Oxidized low density lipoprotein receptor 1 n=6 Tax=Homininae TaxID=207598 RepID=B7ZAN8_HUMAN|nr:oxidized low density lipoprotein receptor 1 [Homo sapiens]KAI4064655.1 oxidized low density lipoprotein receptor 1 [Homo sapiens]PNI98593.1 OLR1 isoform 9 [Pan troglodytes]BAH14724.1 unnamed protein product [Homo sapiens]
MIETLARKLNEKSKEQMELHHQNLNLQETLKRVANCSGLHPASNFLFQFSILDGAVSEEPQLPMALGGRFSFDAPLI